MTKKEFAEIYIQEITLLHEETERSMSNAESSLRVVKKRMIIFIVTDSIIVVLALAALLCVLLGFSGFGPGKYLLLFAVTFATTQAFFALEKTLQFLPLQEKKIKELRQGWEKQKKEFEETISKMKMVN